MLILTDMPELYLDKPVFQNNSWELGDPFYSRSAPTVSETYAVLKTLLITVS
jgi:hypothetical protein